MAKENGYYTIREYLEKQYSSVISIPQYWEHYIDDFNKVYLISTKLRNGDRYVIQSKWKKIFPYGRKMWVVEQHGDIVRGDIFSREIKRYVNEFVKKYGHTDKNSRKIYVKTFDRIKKINSMMYNILTGVLLKRFVNPDYLNHENEIKVRYCDFGVDLKMIWRDIYGNYGFNKIIIKGFKYSQICKIENKFYKYCTRDDDMNYNKFLIKNDSIIFYYSYIGLSIPYIKRKMRILGDYVNNLRNMNDVYKFIEKIIL